METLTQFLGTYGYWIFLGLGFAEFAGVPIASTPLLIAGGGLAAAGGLEAPLIIGAAASGAFLADVAWYSLARWRGGAVVDSACGLSSNPSACVYAVEEKVSRSGHGYMLLAKFIPGVGNLVAPAAGLAGLRPLPFLALDAVALILWAGAYVTLGWIFADQVAAVIRVVADSYRIVMIAGGFVVAGFGVWRAVKLVRHRRLHELHGVSAEPGVG